MTKGTHSITIDNREAPATFVIEKEARLLWWANTAESIDKLAKVLQNTIESQYPPSVMDYFGACLALNHSRRNDPYVSKPNSNDNEDHSDGQTLDKSTTERLRHPTATEHDLWISVLRNTQDGDSRAFLAKRI